jgi:hypothetical protein
LAHQPEGGASSAGEQLVSNKVECLYEKRGLIISMVSPTFFGKPYGFKNSFFI